MGSLGRDLDKWLNEGNNKKDGRIALKHPPKHISPNYSYMPAYSIQEERYQKLLELEDLLDRSNLDMLQLAALVDNKEKQKQYIEYVEQLLPILKEKGDESLSSLIRLLEDSVNEWWEV